MAGKRVTLVESEQSLDQLRRSMPNVELEEIEIVVRAPDRADAREVAHAASLCACRQVCVAIIEQ
ncbi:MAG: hypothetical protein JO328_18125 [Hyphomicrobiales bacterium]|nr:hypothetical protein [Hyphomicrobiales bacterium]MBV8827173.1 hypothetical protein [Hyphomicrobiales bacterium]